MSRPVRARQLLSALAAALLALAGAAPAAPARAQSVAPADPARPVPPASAPASAAAPAPPAPGGAAALTAEDLGRWLDGLMPYALQHGDVPGAVVVVVKDGRPLFERGYGYADVAARRPVDPATTLFRPGSISKTFTWTAVMQLVQAGRIDLDRDVNAYLDFRIPPAFGRPVTMRELMTHSAGFADVEKGLIVMDPARSAPLGAWLKAHAPARIYPPGEIPAYSNWGAALAGYIVQRVSGEPFPAYVQRRIFAPLGMAHASFQQPLPPGLAAEMAKGYGLGSAPPRPFEYVPAPAGALSASGDDIGRWMIAQLQDGQLGGRRILDAATAQEMHRPHFRPIPDLPAMALGFYETPAPGRRVIAHMGDTELFHSDMHLFLDDGVGLYVSMNGGGRDAATYAIRKALYQGFLQRYFPAPPPPSAAPTWPDAARDGRTLSGMYISTGRGAPGWRWLSEVLLGQAKVSSDANGVVTVSSMRGLADQPIRWREVGPFQYVQVGGPWRMAAKVRAGRPVLLAADDFPPVEALQPTPALYSASWNGPLLQFTLLGLLIAFVAWPTGALARRRYGAPATRSGRRAWTYAAGRAGCGLELAFLAGLVLFMQHAGADIDALSARSDPVLLGLELLGVLAVGGLAAGVWDAVRATADPGRRWWARLAAALLAVACLAAIWFDLGFHLVGWPLHY